MKKFKSIHLVEKDFGNRDESTIEKLLEFLECHGSNAGAVLIVFEPNTSQKRHSEFDLRRINQACMHGRKKMKKDFCQY